MPKRQSRTTPPTLPRRMPSGHGSAAIRRHARLVGEVVWAWNDLHRNFGLAFASVLESRNPILPHAIWAALTTDRAQRDMLAATINHHFAPDSLKYHRIKWAIDAANSLSTLRNDAVHVPTMLRLGSPIRTTTGYLGVSLSRVMRLNQVDFCELLQTLRGDIRQLSEYVLWIARWIGPHGKQGPLPRKPALLTRQLFQAPLSPNTGLHSRKARKPPPRSSRG